VSDFRSIAAVTEALRVTLEKPVHDTFSGGTPVESRRPDQPPDPVTSQDGSGISIYLYQVTPNAALRNADLPTRDNNGLVQRPRAALDLHYLLTFHGSEGTFKPQLLLGLATLILHTTPILTQAALELAFDKTGSNLREAVERVRFTPVPLSLEELSKLWSVFFHAKYALSTAYQASVVILEGEETPAPALPVLEHRVKVVPSLGPVIDSIASSLAPAPPRENQPVLLGDTLRIRGQNLRGDVTRIRFGEQLVPPTTIANDELTLVVDGSLPAAALRAGIRSVQVVHDVEFGPPSGLHRGFESNGVPFMLAPRVTPVPASQPVPNFTVSTDLTVLKGQRLTLLLSETPLPISGAPLAYAFSKVAPADGATQTIETAGVATGRTYLVRLQVDGAQSPLGIDAAGHYNGSPSLQVLP
jgi:hypothetical protein